MIETHYYFVDMRDNETYSVVEAGSPYAQIALSMARNSQEKGKLSGIRKQRTYILGTDIKGKLRTIKFSEGMVLEELEELAKTEAELL